MLLFSLLFSLLVGVSVAQRPSTASVCDYYAEKLYGTNSSDSQHRLIQSIVSLAFGGPSGLQNVSSTDLTGILNNGSYQGTVVDLAPYFNGSIDSTNLNNAPVGLNWLDGGGDQPLNDFLNGKSATVQIDNSTNQYRLFSHFFTAFSHIYGCSLPIASTASSGATGGSSQLSIAYVHKYMDLNNTELSHFIDQFGQAAMYFGFSEQDSQAVTNQLNSQYNTRCGPPVAGANGQLQLDSICLDPSCPLAPEPDCAPYSDLQPGGYTSTGGPTATATATPFTPTSISQTTTPTAASTTTSPAATTSAPASSSSGLSGGAIAGIVIGALAVVAMAVALGFYFFKKRPGGAAPSEKYSNFTPSYASPTLSEPITYSSNFRAPQPPPSQPEHYAGPPIAEMDTPMHYGAANPAYIINPEPGHPYHGSPEMPGDEPKFQHTGHLYR